MAPRRSSNQLDDIILLTSFSDEISQLERKLGLDSDALIKAIVQALDKVRRPSLWPSLPIEKKPSPPETYIYHLSETAAFIFRREVEYVHGLQVRRTYVPLTLVRTARPRPA